MSYFRARRLLRVILYFVCALSGLALSTSGVGAAARTSVVDKLIPPGRPLTVSIPRIGVHASLESVALATDHDVRAPFRWEDAGWFNRGPRPGAVGRAVIFGHLDSTCCPAVFWSLGTLKWGDVVQVQYADGRTLSFRVLWQHTYADATLPVRWIFGGGTGPRALLLYTCAGVFHTDGTGYDHKLVVYARLILPNGHLG